MINEKMSDIFALPTVVRPGGVMPFLNDKNGSLIAVLDEKHARPIMVALNNYDAMEQALKNITEIVEGILDSPNIINIAHHLDDNDLAELVGVLKRARGEQ